MNKPLPSEENALPPSEPGIQMQVENTAVDGGIQALMGNDNIQFQGDSNIVTFNKTEILQISVEEIKTRKFIQTSPYKSLNKFESVDKDLFFGRDQFLRSLVKELEQSNLILLLGASGSGKSSVVHAGLIPWLSQKYGSRLVNLKFTPDIDPFESFYASLLNKYKQTEAQIAREAKADTLTQIVERLKQPDDYWFILIDQFEELFTTSLGDKRDQFIKSLVKLSKTKQSSVKIMGTMRADFLDRLSPYSHLVTATDKHRPLIAEMQPDELRLAIEQPAAYHGVVFETGLVKEIIKDVQGQAGYLPLLQYTLNLLWEEELRTGSINDRTLNLSTYRQLGGVRGALQKHVNYIYDTLPEVEKLATRKIFLKLVEIGENFKIGSEWKPVRRRALRSEFSDELEQTVLIKLINKNLLVSDRQPQSQESTVEIAHEILLTSWTTLNTWIEENRHAIALRNRLNDDVANWQAKKADDELWSGSKLDKVVELRKDSTFNQVLGGFSDTANQFIDASVEWSDRQLVEEKRRKRERKLLGSSIMAMAIAAIAVPLTLAGNVLSTLQHRSNVIFAQPGQHIDGKTKYRLTYNQELIEGWSRSSPNTINQIVFGIPRENESTDCIQVGIIQGENRGDKNGEHPISLTAPKNPGVYYIHFGNETQYDCNSDEFALNAKRNWQNRWKDKGQYNSDSDSNSEKTIIGVVIVGNLIDIIFHWSKIQSVFNKNIPNEVTQGSFGPKGTIYVSLGDFSINSARFNQSH